MSQNKTVIPGMEPSDGNNYGASNNASSSFYSRNNRPAARGTYVPGMSDGLAEPRARLSGEEQTINTSRTVASGKPVVGFLYSVSRTPAGEFWPLHIGQNTIGQDPSCDIMLSEGTVSAEHAVLVVRKLKNPVKVIASISDARSTNGTLLNGESLGFSALECFNGDIITIGQNYELFIILIDAAALGLSPSETFIPVEVEEEDDEIPSMPDGITRHGVDYLSSSSFGGFNANGTIGMDGRGPQNDKGGTIGM